MSAALQKKVGIDDDALNRGAAQLATFGLQAKSVVNLTKSLADFTINQDGLNASSEQYIGNANIIAKALNGQFGILEKMGIRFTEAQKALIEFGTEEQKVAAITEGFNQNLRETSDTVAGSAEANFAVLKQTLSEISEEIGKKFIPILQDVIAKIQPIIEKVLEWTSAHPELSRNLLLVGAGVAALVAVVGFLGLALPAIITGFTILLGPVGLVILAIGAVTAATILLVKNWEKIKEFFRQTWDGIKIVFGEAIDWINNKIDSITNSVKNAIAQLNQLASKVPGSSGLGFTNKLGDSISNFLGIGGKAAGGSVSGGSPYMVGEQGPELFVPNSNGSIVPNGRFGGNNIVLNITGTFLSQDAAEKMANMIFDKLKLEVRI